MTEPLRTPDATRDAKAGPDRESPPRMPRWVKIPAIIIGILIVLFVVAMVTGLGGDHGPGRHEPGQNQQTHDPSRWDH